jgi:Domain of unknown function (DUF4349)
MIDEAILEELLAQFADEIPIPAAGPGRILDALAATSKPKSRSRSRFANPLAIAGAAAVVIGLVAVPLIIGSNTQGSAKQSSAPAAGSSTKSRDATLAPAPHLAFDGAPAGPVDAAKIVKTGTLDLRVARATLRVTVNRVTGVTVGLGGYIADSKTSYGGSNPTAQVTIRVPVQDFETAIARLEALSGVTVSGESENGADVTAQYTDLQAQLQAASGERDQLLTVLSHAQSIGDILAVHDRISTVQTGIDQLQGKIKLLDDQATLSSLAVTLSEKPAANAAAHKASPETGLAKSWSDARQGFANAVEWLIARSGGALIVVLTLLALLFAVRYLYPVVRRGLV